MQPRFIIRTHREISHPGFFSALIRHCTSAIKSLPNSTVAICLAKLFSKSEKYRLSRRARSVGGADFAVETAQKFGFLTPNCFWNWKGHVINALVRHDVISTPIEYFKLTYYEKVMYLRYYLESEGALIYEFSKLLLDRDSISYSEFSNEPHVENMFIRIWKGYLPLSSQLTFRIELKNKISHLQRHGYKPDTRRHKFIPIIMPMIDFGFIKLNNSFGNETYSLAYSNNKIPLKILIKELISFEQMEIRFKDFDYYDIISKCFNLAKPKQSIIKETLGTYLKKAYDAVKQEGTGLASLDAIVDIVCVKFLIDFGQLITRKEILNLLDEYKIKNPAQVRYHLNRQGKRTFVVIAPEALIY